jgi:uncharacterized protein involved in exopolysaccharide biosynthesis
MDKQHKENIGLRPIIVDYLRHWKLILGTGIFSLIVAVLYLVVYPTTYETMARVQIQEEHDLMATGSIGLGEAAGLMKSFGLGGMGKSGVTIDDEILTFYSSNLMSEAVTRLGLYVEYTKPYIFWYKMYGEEPVIVFCDPTTLTDMHESIQFHINAEKDGKIRIKSKTKKETHKFQFESFPAIIEVKQGRFVFTKNPDESASSFKIKAEVFPPTWVAEMLAKDMNVEDYSKSSSMVEFTYQDHKIQRAKDIMNTLIALYNEDAYSYKRKIGNASLEFLEERIVNVVADLNDVERQIETYKAANKLTGVQYDIQYYAEYMRDLRIKILELEKDTKMVELMEEFVKDPKNKYELIPSLYTTNAENETSPISLYNVVLMDRGRALKNATEDNPVVIDLTTRADQLRESVFQMIDNAHQAQMIAKKELENSEKQLLKKMDAVPEQIRIFVDYTRQQEIFQGVYLILLQKREEIALSIGQNVDKAKIIDAAFVMKKPVAPRKLYAAIGLIFLTLFISIGWLFCKEQTVAIWRLLKEEKNGTNT